MVISERLYPIRRPLAALCAGAAVALFGGLIGLGGAEFRLPILITVFALYAHRAIRINLLVSLATLAVSAAARLGFLPSTHVLDFTTEIVGMLAGGMVAAWLGASLLTRIPKTHIMGVIAVLLIGTAVLLAAETLFHGSNWVALSQDSMLRPFVAFAAGLWSEPSAACWALPVGSS